MLIDKLITNWHLNVPERQRFPDGRAKASPLLCQSPREAAKIQVRSLFGAEIDGIPID